MGVSLLSDEELLSSLFGFFTAKKLKVDDKKKIEKIQKMYKIKFSNLNFLESMDSSSIFNGSLAESLHKSKVTCIFDTKLIQVFLGTFTTNPDITDIIHLECMYLGWILLNNQNSMLEVTSTLIECFLKVANTDIRDQNQQSIVLSLIHNIFTYILTKYPRFRRGFTAIWRPIFRPIF